MRIPRSRLAMPIAGVIVACLWIPNATAAPITVDWDVVPHADGQIAFDDSPYYQCYGDDYANRLCGWLWEQGLELSGIGYSFYDDKFVDGFGVGEGEGNISEGLRGGQRISPLCKSGLDPCFDSFTPVTLRLLGSWDQGPAPNIFVISSNGGLIKLPSLSGLATLNLSGSEWEDLGWLEIGFYIADNCDEEFDECDIATEKAFSVEDLTFEGHAVPEPSLIVLIGAGICAVGRRKYHAKTARTADGNHTETISF